MLQRQIADIVRSVEPPADAFDGWRREVSHFLSKNPLGWQIPKVSVTVGPRAPAGKAKKAAAAKPMTPPKGKDAPKEVKSEPEPPKPLYEINPDGRVVFEKKPPATVDLDFSGYAGWLAAVKIELLPDAKHANRILQSGNSTLFKPVFSVVGKDGKSQPLAIRHVQADRTRSPICEWF